MVEPSEHPGSTSPFHWDAEVLPGLRVAFTSMHAGNLALHVGDDPDAVRGNRTRLEASMGLRGGSLQFMSQTHSDRVALLTGTTEPDASAPDADAMVSDDGSRPLAVLVADCVPIVLADTSATYSAGPTAVVHAGRAGVGLGIVGNAVDVLRAQGAQEISAWIGPSVCGSCYEVPEGMMHELAGRIPAAAARTRTGTPALDLPAAVRSQLVERSVDVRAVGGHGASCTLENTQLYSHRRAPGAGRIAGLVWRT